MKTKYVKGFYFDLAQYLISDGSNRFALKVDYRGNKYSIEAAGTRLPQQLRKELNEIAKDLLVRKRAKNFAEQADVQ